MTDYSRSTGTTGTMLVRYLPMTHMVEYWINSGDGVTSGSIPWTHKTDGSNHSGTYNYIANSGLVRVAQHEVSESQTVTFKLGATGKPAFGGPTELSVNIVRTELPDPPAEVTFSSIGATMLVADFEDGESDGGAEIDERQIGYGTSSNIQNMLHTQSFQDYANVSGLTTGVTYYFWGRTHNENGWSNWGPRSSVKTLKTPDAPTAPLLTNVTPISVQVSWQNNSSGGSPFTGFQVGYSTDDEDTAPDIILSATNPQQVTNLTPGVTYFFWVRARNSLGWGPWSAKSSTATHTGIRIFTSNTWKLAVPYVRQGGVWKRAVPYCKTAGEWKETV